MRNFFRHIKNINFIFSNLFTKIVPFMRYAEIYVTARQVTDDSIISRTRIVCWVTKVRGQTLPHKISYILISPGNNSYTNATQYYVIRTLPVLFSIFVVYLTEASVTQCIQDEYHSLEKSLRHSSFRELKTASQLVNKFPIIRRFITVFIKPRRWILRLIKWFHFKIQTVLF